MLLKKTTYFMSFSLCVTMMLNMVGCAGDQEGQQGEEVQTNEQGDQQYQDEGDQQYQDESDQNGQDQYQDDSQGQNYQEQQGYGDSANINNDAANEFDDGVGAAIEETANSSNESFQGNEFLQPESDTSLQAYTNDANIMQDDTIANSDSNDNVNTPNTVALSPSEGGRVFYVTAAGSQMYQTAGSNPIKQLEQGDHSLIYQESEWGKTTEGFYIPFNELSSAPIGRKRRAATWR